LALKLGKTPSQLLRETTSADISELIAYHVLEREEREQSVTEDALTKMFGEAS
jgi:hypothetical protein